jgi:hypothetical protein
MLDPLVGSSIGSVFVAMSFDESPRDVYKIGIEAAIEGCGLRSIRLDEETFSGKICEQILTEIRRAQYVIAEVTHHQPSVYFEAGYSLALGKTVIWCCRDEDFEEVHFDTRQYPHIVWKEASDLDGQLRRKLEYFAFCQPCDLTSYFKRESVIRTIECVLAQSLVDDDPDAIGP